MPLSGTKNQFSSIAQSCPTLWDPMNCSMPGLPYLSPAPETYSNSSIEFVMPSNHLILCRPLLLPPSIPPSIRVSSSEPAVHITGGQSIGVSASASVLPINTQELSPLGWTGWISLQTPLKSLLPHHSSKASILQH